MNHPNINTTGYFEVKAPFTIKPKVIYKVTAVRNFSELYISGIDVYSQFYKPHGLISGIEFEGAPFDFAIEAKKEPVIVTLEGRDDTVIYVPSTFILRIPQVTASQYSRIIMSTDLGALPDYVNLESIMVDVQELINKRCGINSTVKLFRGYTDTQPTPEEHAILEQSRLGNIATNENNYSQLVSQTIKVTGLETKIQLMTDILAENGLI